MRAKQFGLHTVLDVLLIGAGCVLAFGWIELPQFNPLYAIALAVAGVILVAIPVPTVRRLSIAAALLGIYLILRDTGMIDIPLLQYGLAFLLFVVGVMSIVRDTFAPPRNQTAEQEVKKD